MSADKSPLRYLTPCGVEVLYRLAGLYGPSGRPGQPATAARIAAKSGYAPSTVRRALQDLRPRGYVEWDEPVVAPAYRATALGEKAARANLAYWREARP